MEENNAMVLKITDDGVEYLKEKIKEQEHAVAGILRNREYNMRYHGHDTLPLTQKRNALIKKYKRAVKEKRYAFEPGDTLDSIMLHLFSINNWIVIE